VRSSQPSLHPVPPDDDSLLCSGNLGISALSPSQRRHFDEYGYLVLRQFCGASEIAGLRATLVHLFNDRIGRDEGSQFDMLGPDLEVAGARQPQIIKPGQFAPELLRSSFVTRTSRIARQLLGSDAQFSFDHSILKPAGTATATPWHQDEAHQTSQLLRYPQISCWLALQDTTLENGCMRYVPGSITARYFPIAGSMTIRASMPSSVPPSTSMNRWRWQYPSPPAPAYCTTH
jgi:hypothetical protein